MASPRVVRQRDVMSNKSHSRPTFAHPTALPRPKSTGPWAILYFKRHRSDDPAETRPGRDYLNGLPPQIRAQLVAVIKAVADAPPPAHSGGGKWEAMKGDMAGYYQVKADGFQSGRRLHCRVFCFLERETATNGLPGPSLIILGGMTKPYLTVFTTADYARIRALGDEYLNRQPRSVAQ